MASTCTGKGRCIYNTHIPHPKTCKQYVSRRLLARHMHILGLNSNLRVCPGKHSTAPCERKHKIGRLRKQAKHSFLGRGIPRLSFSFCFSAFLSCLVWFFFFEAGSYSPGYPQTPNLPASTSEYWDRSRHVCLYLICLARVPTRVGVLPETEHFPFQSPGTTSSSQTCRTGRSRAEGEVNDLRQRVENSKTGLER